MGTIINDQLASGDYPNAFEVIAEALQSRFQQHDLDLTPVAIQEIREESNTLDAELANGTAELIDFDEVAEEMTREYP